MFFITVVAIARVCIAMAQPSNVPHSACLMTMTEKSTGDIKVPAGAVLVNTEGKEKHCHLLASTTCPDGRLTHPKGGIVTSLELLTNSPPKDEPVHPKQSFVHSLSSTVDDEELSATVKLQDNPIPLQADGDDTCESDTDSCVSDHSLNDAVTALPALQLPTMKDSGDGFLSNMDVDGLIDDDDETSGVKRKRVRTKDHGGRSRKQAKPKRPQPNSFVAVQIASPMIREKLRGVQDAIVKHDKQLSKVLTSLKKLHITLIPIRMENEEDIKRWLDFLNKRLVYFT